MRKIWIVTVLALVAALTTVGRASAQESGSLDEVVVAGGIADVSGQAVGNPTVHAYLDGSFAASGVAGPRFELTLAVVPGEHEVCVYAIAPGATGNPTLGCQEFTVATAADGPWVAVSSDFHVSTEGGRWPENDARLEAFVAELTGAEVPPELLAVAGDMIDNIAIDDGRLGPGDSDRWDADTERYLEITADLDDIDTLHALGPGHDFNRAVSATEAEAVFGTRRGYRDWRGTRIIWTESEPPDSTLKWLDQVLDSAPEHAVLVFHVPLRTDATSRLDVGRTLAPNHPLYDVIDDHSDTIDAIVSGHIHRASASRIFDIPVHLCPLIDGGSYCRLVATDAGIVVERAELAPTD
jgi:hypothetical protein